MYHIPDPYRWLEETNSKATTAWVDAEIAITDKFLAQCSLKEKFMDKLKKLSKVAKTGMPAKRG